MDIIEQLVPTTIVALARFPGLSAPSCGLILVGVVVEEQCNYIFRDLVLNDTTGRICVRFEHGGNCSSLLGKYVVVTG